MASWRGEDGNEDCDVTVRMTRFTVHHRARAMITGREPVDRPPCWLYAPCTASRQAPQPPQQLQYWTFAPLANICPTYLTLILNKGKGSPYSITERRISELIPVLGSQPAGGVSHKPGGRLPLISARPVVTLATLKRTATNFAASTTGFLFNPTNGCQILTDSRRVLPCLAGEMSGEVTSPALSERVLNYLRPAEAGVRAAAGRRRSGARAAGASVRSERRIRSTIPRLLNRTRGRGPAAPAPAQAAARSVGRPGVMARRRPGRC